MFLMLVTAVMIMGACSKKDQTGTTSTTNIGSLPTKAADYVELNYPDASIDYILVLSNSTAKYVVSLNTTEALAFSGEGNYLGDGKQYCNGMHPGDSIPGDTNDNGWHHRHHHHGGPPGGGHGIPLDSLSQVIKDYIAANWPGYNILHADYDSLCVDGLVREVMIGKKDSLPPLKIVFSNADVYLLQAQRYRYADVPQAVKDYVTANYAGYQVCPESEQYTLADNSKQYMVYLRLDKEHKRLRITAGGTLVCSQ